MELKLDVCRLKELLTDFHTLTDIKIVIFDNRFTELMSYPENPSDFCAILRGNPRAKAFCDASDKNACEICRQNGGLYIYKCHAGLIEAVAPIRIDDVILGYIMFGQLIDRADREGAEKDMLARCRGYGADSGALSEAFGRLIYKSTRQIQAASKIMESCACYLWIEKIFSVDEGNLIYKLITYISNNLCGDLSVDRLCGVLSVSRSRMYALSRQYFGMSIARYVRRKRVDCAAKLLSETRCSVGRAAEMSGFDDYNYFSKVFKRETGRLPKEFKNAEAGSRNPSGENS